MMPRYVLILDRNVPKKNVRYSDKTRSLSVKKWFWLDQRHDGVLHPITLIAVATIHGPCTVRCAVSRLAIEYDGKDTVRGKEEIDGERKGVGDGRSAAGLTVPNKRPDAEYARVGQAARRPIRKVLYPGELPPLLPNPPIRLPTCPFQLESLILPTRVPTRPGRRSRIQHDVYNSFIHVNAQYVCMVR